MGKEKKCESKEATMLGSCYQGSKLQYFSNNSRRVYFWEDNERREKTDILN